LEGGGVSLTVDGEIYLSVDELSNDFTSNGYAGVTFGEGCV